CTRAGQILPATFDLPPPGVRENRSLGGVGREYLDRLPEPIPRRHPSTHDGLQAPRGRHPVHPSETIGCYTGDWERLAGVEHAANRELPSCLNAIVDYHFFDDLRVEVAERSYEHAVPRCLEKADAAPLDEVRVDRGSLVLLVGIGFWIAGREGQ